MEPACNALSTHTTKKTKKKTKRPDRVWETGFFWMEPAGNALSTHTTKKTKKKGDRVPLNGVRLSPTHTKKKSKNKQRDVIVYGRQVFFGWSLPLFRHIQPKNQNEET